MSPRGNDELNLVENMVTYVLDKTHKQKEKLNYVL